MPARLRARTPAHIQHNAGRCLRTPAAPAPAGRHASASEERRRRTRRGSILCLLAGAIATALPLTAAAQDYPVRPVRVIVGFTPGGAPDLVARQMADPLGAHFGHTFVVDNRPGANGVIGADIVSKATPDGHTLLVTSASFAINPSIYRKLPYDPLRDLAPVTNIALGGGLLLCVNASSPIRSVKELIAAARKPGARFTYGSSGIGNSQHLTAALFNARAGTQMSHVPYKGGGQAIAALLGSEVNILFASTTSTMAYIKAGRLRPLAYNHSKRLDALPDVPTLAEAGVSGTEIEGGSWYGVFAPPQTPRAIVVRLQQEIARAAREPKVRSRFATLGLEPDGRTPEEFKRFVERSIASFRELVQLAGIEPQ
jgi:tripartite-type tricarboxylate transporter receptor subunit TctC